MPQLRVLHLQETSLSVIPTMLPVRIWVRLGDFRHLPNSKSCMTTAYVSGLLRMAWQDDALPQIKMVILFSFLPLASTLVRRCTIVARTATTGLLLCIRVRMVAACTSIRLVWIPRTTTIASTASLCGLFSNLPSSELHFSEQAA